ncbi:MAG: S8 family serine peptidase [Candidatus Lokiarchaeia archaeon]
MTKLILTDTTNVHLLKKRWYFRDYPKDSVLGINLTNAYTKHLLGKKGEEIIIALIDSDVYIEHEDLQNQIWVNKNEIPNNNIDDDNNGYVDDIHGWNFLSNKKGERTIFSNSSHIDFIRKYKTVYENNSIKDSALLSTYKKALKSIKSSNESADNLYKEAVDYEAEMTAAFKAMDSLFKNENYTNKELDSVDELYYDSNEILSAKASVVHEYNVYGYHDYAQKLKDDSKALKEKSNNINFISRKAIGDNVEDISDKNYGHFKINNNTDKLFHGTEMAGVIVGNRLNNKNFEGVSINTKLMVLSVFPRKGGETDKDIALAIYYAVDNGAKVINYSSTKIFSTNNKFVQDALKYAEKNNVLFVTSAGNSSMNLDNEITYPNRYLEKSTLNNFIKVGASHAFYKDMVMYFSNYGKKNVDLFAPGLQFKATTSDGKTKLVDGTSVASAIVSSIGGMVYSYYPNLSVLEVKNAILKGVNVYDQNVVVSDSIKMNFKDLSITGGIIDAYKVLKEAEKISINK